MIARVPPELLVSYDPIDQQHAALLATLEEAARAARADDLAGVRAQVDALGDALMAHFAAEEAFMGESLYPERARHKVAHDLFLLDFAEFGRELEGHGLGDLAVQWITARIPEWFRFHIAVNDAPLGRYLAARGFRPRPATQPADQKPRAR